MNDDEQYHYEYQMPLFPDIDVDYEEWVRRYMENKPVLGSMEGGIMHQEHILEGQEIAVPREEISSREVVWQDAAGPADPHYPVGSSGERLMKMAPLVSTPSRERNPYLAGLLASLELSIYKAVAELDPEGIRDCVRKQLAEHEGRLERRYGMSMMELRLREECGVWDELGFGDEMRGMLTGRGWQKMGAATYFEYVASGAVVREEDDLLEKYGLGEVDRERVKRLGEMVNGF